jgi:cytochrome c-type biogenesis protein CcmH
MQFLRTLLLLLAFGTSALAVQPGEQLKDAALETRARELSRGLRCLVCQNQTIDDSDAPLARDLRLLVRERLQSGDDDAAVMRFIVMRYGDFVLMSPPMDARTILLWAGPFGALALGAVLVWSLSRRRRALVAEAPLTAQEQAELERLTAPPVG